MLNCRNCGTEVDEGERFCYLCGSKLNETHATDKGNASDSATKQVTRPTASFVLSLIGGIIILLVGILFILSGYTAQTGLFFPELVSSGITGVAIGLVIIVNSVLLRAVPRRHVIWGLLIVIFSFGSWFYVLGGFLLGLVLGVVGGALAIIWKPFELRTGTQQAVNLPSPTIMNSSVPTNQRDNLETHTQGTLPNSIDYLFRIRGQYRDYFLTESGISEVKIRSKAAGAAINQLGIVGSIVNASLSKKASKDAVSLNLSDLRNEGRVIADVPWSNIKMVSLVGRKLKIRGGGLRVSIKLARSFPNSKGMPTLVSIFSNKLGQRFTTSYNISMGQTSYSR